LEKKVREYFKSNPKKEIKVPNIDKTVDEWYFDNITFYLTYYSINIKIIVEWNILFCL
jgi:hypothetical protein